MVSASEIVQQPVGKEQGRHVGQKQANTARMDIATLEVSSPTGHKSGGVWAASLIHVKSELNQFLPCLAQKSPGEAGDFSVSGLCKGPCIKRFPSLGHFLRLSIFSIILTPESKETQVPTSLEKSGHGRFSSALSWLGVQCPLSRCSIRGSSTLAFRTKSIFSLTAAQGLGNYRSHTLEVWLAWHRQSSHNREMEILVTSNHREAQEVTKPNSQKTMKSKLKLHRLLKFPVLFKYSQHR